MNYQINDLIYHKTFGFGYITKADDISVTIDFHSFIKKIVAGFEMQIISKDIADKVRNQNSPLFDFTGDINQKGIKYYQDKRIKVLNVDGDAILFSIDGHQVNINLKKDEASCTCSSGKCKHIAAAMHYLYESFSFKKPNLSLEISDEVRMIKEKLKKMIDDYAINPEYSQILKIVDLLAANISNLDICKFLLYCFKTIYEDDLEKLIFGFFHHNKIYSQMISVRFSTLFTKRQMAFFNSLFMSYRLSKSKFWSNPLYLLINKRYDEFMELMISTNNRYIDELGEVIEFIDFSTCKEETLRYMAAFPTYASFIRDYIDLSIDDIKMGIDNRFNLSYKDVDLVQLDNEYIFKALNNRCLSEEKAYQFLCDHKERLIVDDEDFVKTVANNIPRQYINKTNLKNIFLGLNDTIYVQRVLLKRELTMPILVDKDPYIKPNVLFKYFDYDYEVDYKNNSIQIIYSIDFLWFRLDIIVKDNKIKKFTEKDLDNAKILTDYLFSLHSEDISDRIESLKKEQAEKIEKENQKFLNSLIDYTFPSMSENLHSYAENRKARLELYVIQDESLSIKMKIGIDKFYVVKDLSGLIQSFYENETKTYGKNFTFTHRIENLAKPYDKLMEYFLEIAYQEQREYYYYSQIKYLMELNTYNIRHIFELLKGEYFYFNNEYTKINLDLLKGNPSIDANYRMHTGFPDNYQYIILADTIFIIHDKIMDVLDADAKEVKLFQFILNLQNKSIKPALNRFKNEIYYHFEDKINVSEDIKNDFMIEKLKCELYFDYNENVLSVEDKYYINEKLIDKDEIVSYKDLVVYNHIQGILTELGFVDHQCTSDSKIIEFFNLNFEEIRKIASVFLSDSIQNKMVIRFTPPQLKINNESTMFNAFYEESNFTDDELYDIYKALKRKKKYIVLSDDRIIDLSEKQSMDFLQTIDEFGLNPQKPQDPVNIPVYKALEAQALVQKVEISDYVRTIIEEIKNYKELNLPKPNIDAKLRDYQMEGLKWLWILAKHHLDGILADDMGLGKTIQIIALISEFKTNLPSLIACPKSLVFNWLNEFRKFAPNIDVVEIYGGQLERRKIITSIQKDSNIVYVTSYDSLSRDLDYYQNEFEFLIIDEAQAIKNSQTNKSKSVKQIKSKTRFALTGTPIENSVLDLWSIFDFLMPDYFDSIDVFKRRYLNENDYQERIIKKISPFVLRRTKKDVLYDLPEKYERVYSVDMNEDQRKVYDSFCLKAKNMIDSGEKVFSLLPMLTRLRQLCIAPSMFLEGDYSSGKLDALKQILNDYSEHKILIFSSFVKAINILEDYFSSNHIEYYVITGDTNAKERIRLCNEFNNNDVKIFLISLKAGGFGLNLTGADTIIHLDPWWNLSAENQASDRAHRIGQKKNVEVIKLVCTNSIEQRVIELQNLKKDIFDKLISSNDERITSLSIEDLNFILN